jgi:hypothetical protein
MKRMIISEEEKKRILGMHQDATKRHYLGEQQAIGGEYSSESKTTYTSGRGVKYYVPNLDGNTYTNFVSFNRFDTFPAKLSLLKKLDVKANIGPINPLAVPQEEFDKQVETVFQKVKGGQDVDMAIKSLPLLSNLEFLESLLSGALETYLSSWRPKLKGMDLVKNVAFNTKPTIVNAKKYISNFDEVFPKLLQSQSEYSGLNIS